MKKRDYEEVIEPVGILWNVSDKFARNIIMELAVKYPITQIQLYDLNGEYEKFVEEIYKGDVPDFRIKQKLEHMSVEAKKSIVVFALEVKNPQYHVEERKKHQSCIEIDELKSNIRKNYSNRVENYFFDIILHMTDNDEEKESTLNILNKYSKCCKKNYTRKGYEPIIMFENNEENIKQCEWCTDILKDLKCSKDDDREGI